MEVDREQEEEPKIHNYDSIQKMLQETYKEVEGIINGSKKDK